MIEYVTPENIDDRVVARAVNLLNRGGLAALPTDTSWALTCSLASKVGIKHLKSLSRERDERHFTLLCADISQFGELCGMDNTRFRLIKRLSPGPYTFILKTLPGTEKSLDIRRREVGIRIPDHPIPRALIRALGSPLYSITAKRDMAGPGGDREGGNGPADIPEEDLFEADWELESIESLDMIISGDESQPRIFSTVLDMTEDEVRVIRQGAGKWPA
ncbi:MAG: L-threonylcarbamoyladenylate synthase [Treponema sp.]|jgi:tRNA threonylcarbamoyl adenosine modification protein (Sua5/YciO/YrdC/YwlC family)|nr:L-threonylcarbamoyladenylate synthase [Treponema sp.]